jgi:acetoacetyl-CoA reductase
MARVALVTGGTRGIGAGIAKRLQKEDYKVAVCDVVEDQIAKFKEETGIPATTSTSPTTTRWSMA